jgi:hypothetical protein
MEITTITAQLDDEMEMTQFLASIPNGVGLARVLEHGKPVSTRAYEDETWTAWERNVALSETAFKKAVETALGG